jgi:hypothetical protein
MPRLRVLDTRFIRLKMARHSLSGTRAPQPEAALVDEICFQWGTDVLRIRDPSWCRAILDESSLPSPDDVGLLGSRYSREDEVLIRMGMTSLEELEGRPKGVNQLAQPPVAAQCLKTLLGLELPAGLMLRCGSSAPIRLIALRACLYLNRVVLNSFDAYVAFDGLQLYADGRIGTPVRFARTDDYRVQRRTLGNTWYPFSFEGEIHEAKSENSWLPAPSREFWLTEEHLLDSTGLELRRVSL